VKTLLRLASLTLLCIFCTLPGDAAVADAPRSLAELLPDNAVALLETDDLRALLKRWNSSKLHRNFEKSRAANELRKTHLYLRLAQNVEEIEAVAGFGLSLERLTQVAGHRSAVALYDVPSTSFVLVTELTSDEARRTDLFGPRGQMAGRMAAREHRGVKYLLKSGDHGKASLAVALVGERLIAGTDLEAFRGTLVLAARAAGLPVAPAARGGDPTPLAAYGDYASLDAVAPKAPIQLWVNQKHVAGSHYFDDYWIFGKESGARIEAARVALAPGDDLTVETRLYLYEDGARPDVKKDDAGEVGRADVPAAAAALPSAPPFASAFPADSAHAAAALVELLPRGEGADELPSPDAIAAALEPAKPRRAVEALEPSHPKGGFAEHHAAIALGLAAPDALDGKALEAALAAEVQKRVTGGGELAFADAGDGVRALGLPLVSEWSLAWKRAGGALVVATDPAAAKRLAAALAAPATARLLDAGAPRLYRLDVDRAGATWKDATRTLAQRGNFADPNDAELFEKSIGGLFDVVKDTRRVVALGYARGPRQYVEEVQYRSK
jgi:hypothetical protein